MHEPGDVEKPAERKSEVALTVGLLWGPAESGRDRRPRLGVSMIVESAIGLADAEGLEAVSMQRVAGDVGYTTMALYRHVPSKAALITLMADAAAGRPPAASSPEGDWRGEVMGWAGAMWDAYRLHPWMLHAPTRTAPIGPNGLAWLESLLRILSRTGLSGGEMVAQAMFISGAVRDLSRIEAQLVPMGGLGYAGILEQVLEGDRFPTLAAILASGTFGESEDAGVRPSLEIGLVRLLDGIESHVRTVPKPLADDAATR